MTVIMTVDIGYGRYWTRQMVLGDVMSLLFTVWGVWLSFWLERLFVKKPIPGTD